MKSVRKALAATFGGLGLLIANPGIARRSQIQPLRELKLTPHAFGRYILDLPEGTQLVNWVQTFQGTGPIRVNPGVTVEQFNSLTQARAETLLGKKHEDGGPLLERFESLQIPHSRIITYWHNAISLKETFIECEAYFLKDDRLYQFKNHIYYKQPMQDEYFFGFTEMLKSIHSRRPDEIPTEPGACFDSSILVDGPDRDYSEIIMATGIWPDRPDVQFQLAILTNGDQPDPPLLTRLKKAGSLTGLGVLRRGDRTVGPNVGQEHLRRVRENNGTFGHLFIWETQGLPNRVDLPQIRLEMSTGEGQEAPTFSSLSDKDAMRLWDQIVDSLRWRTTNPPTLVQPRAR